MNKLGIEERVRVVSALVEGNSLRSIVRMTNIHRTTIQKLLVELGEACSVYQDKVFRNLNCKRIQCDEIWSFVGCKEKNVDIDNAAKGWGDIWTWVAIDPETKLIPAWYVGDRTAQSAYRFMLSVSRRMINRIQLTTDGHKAYLIGFYSSGLQHP